MKKQNKSLISARTITIACIFIFVIFIGILLYSYANILKDTDTPTVEFDNPTDLWYKVQENMSTMNYCSVTATTEITKAGSEESEITTLIAAGNRLGTEHSYALKNADSSEVYEYVVSEEDGTISLYSYDGSYDVWVKSTIDSGLTRDLWEIIPQDISMFNLIEELPEESTDFYILESLSTGDEGASTYMQIYVDKATLLPTAVTNYQIANVDYDSSTSTSIDLDDPRIPEDAEVTADIPDHDEYLYVMEFNYTNEDTLLFREPESYVTYEEYRQLVYSSQEGVS